MKKIGILGGTFNPIHIGHLAMAQVALEQLKLDQVIFIPSFLPPHKTARNVIAPRNRYDMVKLAIKGNPYFTVSDFEIKRPGKSYSIETVKYLREQFLSKAKIFFIIGEDSLKALHTWKKIDALLNMVTFVAMNRPGFLAKSRLKVKSLTMPGLDISSSYLRKCQASGNSIKYLVPETVFRFIEKNKLYQ